MFDSRTDDELLDLIEGAHRQLSMQMARKLGAVAQLLGRRIEEELALDVDVKSMITGFARTTAEVSAAMNMPPARARRLVGQAEALEARLPAVAALLVAGQLDWDTLEIVIARTELVDEDKCAALDAMLAEQISDWQCWSRQRIVDAVDVVVNTIDAQAAKQRRVVAFDERGVNVSAQPDGMARVRANLGATAGAAFDKRLSQLATSVCKGDPRTLKQRRADAVMALLDGTALACACSDAGCPHRGGQAPVPATSTVLNVIATAATVAGDSQQPGYLAGFGVVDAQMVRELARNAAHHILEPPPISSAQALRYRPSATLDRWIRCRDLTCRFPGCTVPAQRCDIDHTEPFNHADPATGGHTVPENLACYCREHHRLKTFHSGPGGWRDQQLTDGTIVWTSPTGQTYRTTPGGTEVFPQLRAAAPRQRSAAERTRIAAARQRLRQQRPDNDYHRHRNQAAAREIYGRQFRNRFRRTRVFFHGRTTTEKPSTSPFCRWVNDPIEPEELPPNWQPPPMAVSNPDEPPPF